MTERKSLSLSQALYGFVLLCALLAIVGAWFIVRERLADFRQSALTEAVQTRAAGVELVFGRALYQEWRRARTIARDIASRDPGSVRASLDLVVGDGQRVSWAGIAALDGTVINSSGGLLEGRDVSERPWFQRGLEGNFAGDVHEAVLLAELLPAENGPRQFLDLATPIRGADGDVTGVLGLHLDFDWAERFLEETARTLDLDVFLVDRDGTIVLGTDPGVTGSLDLPSMRAATSGAGRAGLERWPDGASYLTTVLPSVGYEDLPSFGWSMVARINSDAFEASRRGLGITLASYMAGFGLLLAALTFLFAEIFLVPLKRLAASARAVLSGALDYPYETTVTDEAAVLSATVSRLQSLLSRKGNSKGR